MAAVSRVDVKPQLLRWARERADLPAKELVRRFPAYLEWEGGKTKPTFKQLRSFAKATYAPFGFLFLPEPPSESFPIQDLRTIGSGAAPRPSVHLRDVVYQCLHRQDWFRAYAVVEGLDPVQLVGSFELGDCVVEAADHARTTLRIALEDRAQMPT